MTNLLNIPQIPAGTSISVSAGEDWRDQLAVSAPGSPGAPIALSGALAGETLTVASSGAVVPGMLALGFGIPAGATVTAVTPTSITLSLPAEISAPNASVTFAPAPLDLTGVSFTSQVRASAASPAVLLCASTAAGTMTNGGTSGVFGWNVPAAIMAATKWPSTLFEQGTAALVVDIVATDSSGAKVNLCAAGPIPLTVNLPVTRQ